jgi:hypothetical protein
VTDNDYGAMIDAEVGTSVSTEYSDVFGAMTSNYGSTTDLTGVSGNISADPVFVSWTDNDDSADDDFELDTGSPCIDAGVPAPPFNDADGSTNDIGAYGGPEGEW